MESIPTIRHECVFSDTRKTLVLGRADLLGLLWSWLDVVEALLRVGTLVLLLAAALVELSGVVPVSGLSIQGYEPSALMG